MQFFASINERMLRVKGIAPSDAAWEAAVLPLNYSRRYPYFTGDERGVIPRPTVLLAFATYFLMI
jgi:hypothetical protein